MNEFTLPSFQLNSLTAKKLKAIRISFKQQLISNQDVYKTFIQTLSQPNELKNYRIFLNLNSLIFFITFNQINLLAIRTQIIDRLSENLKQLVII